MLNSFLMIGQSNMAGRGFLKDVPIIYNHHIKMLRNGRWQTMWEPINYDRPNAGIGLAASFAAALYTENQDSEIGLIPCADGGTSLDDWNIDGVLFQSAISQAKIAQKTSRIKGILWHQGENDCQPGNAPKYGEKFAVIVKKLREELGDSDIPLIIGGLGDFLTEGIYWAYFESYAVVNKELEKFAQNTNHCYFITAAGLTANPDNIHMNAESQRIFGIRYFEGFHKRQHVLKPLTNESKLVEAIYERNLTKEEQKGLIDIQFSMGELSIEAYKN
ncbi:sialate O-acetylesterase [Mucilaginibacter sp. UR6-1]|uniref:sialate O-acetylesterase n=1 Tax=Mucilaginibacter sp. UR6-1 TaxID=1435643 RepID=UPI001E5CA8C9|nr:sialate O-acetylesterase [Mucilaginibacter sp. UR6-1]MCC8407495.1 sialate O-acetylesterase [Mucilaginibacter sp. UR6-1]